MDETPKKPPVPPVAPERAEELPGTRPKPLVDDPKAVKRIRRIMSHPSYVRADRDLNFLAREDYFIAKGGLALNQAAPGVEVTHHGHKQGTIPSQHGGQAREEAEQLPRLQQRDRPLLQ